MNKETIETLLTDFVSASTEIQGAVMVSPQGQPLTHPIGLSEASTHIMAGSMLHLAGCISEQCHWQAVNWVTIQALEGYLILTQCIQDVFLLIRAQDVPSGYLQRYIQHHLAKLRTSLRTPDHDATVVQLSYRPTELIKRRETPANGMVAHSANGSSVAMVDPSTLNGGMGNGEMGNGEMGTVTPPAENGAGYVNGYLVQETTPIPPAPSVPLHLDEFEIAYCQKELAEIIGPIASLICDRVLAQDPHLRLMDFVKVLARHIPDQQQALDFQRRVLSG
ncbi:hypothetical protein [Acaryochloris sp. IP29b_bin.148]|uniref:roadblock/LC7 domain-containing protein n=1 Tax=Acaryochloris sp. IP29b_bin.148 TaxID=2969218 RepID=UPI0026354642|nr:hypothetical protein [Acaryochloris sp. IP29b_bin.148]